MTGTDIPKGSPPHDPRRPRRRRDRSSDGHRIPSPARGRRDEGLGPCRTASRARATARRSRASSMTRCAGKARPPGSWAKPGPRAEMLGALRQTHDLDAEAIAALFSGEGHAPAKLTEAERERLAAADLSGAPSHVVGDFPEWLAPQLEASFGASAAEEGRALAERAPVDLRVNLLKTTRDKALARARPSQARADAALSRGPAHRHAPGRPRAAARLRPGLRQGPRRVAGRGLAARRAPRRSQARHAGPRPLRRRGRQDAGARRRDGQPGPDLRRRPRRASPCADLRAGSPARARAMSRCGRRGAKRTCSPTSKGAAISC